MIKQALFHITMAVIIGFVMTIGFLKFMDYMTGIYGTGYL